MSDIRDLTEKIIKFRDERDWKQFHNPKDLVISLMLEAAELAEHFQWKKEGEMEQYLKEHKEEIGDELSDVLYWILIASHDFDIDLAEAFEKKMKKNAEKYPIDKSKGKYTKYSELES